MIVLREILSFLVFVVSIVFLVGSVSGDLEPILFLIGCLGYMVSYWLWPSKKRGYMRGDHWIYDVVEIIVELPMSVLVWLFRLCASVIKALDFN